MTELFEPVDGHDARLALGPGDGPGEPALSALNAAGVLVAADVHLARTVGRLVAETDPAAVLALALAARAVRHGSVCLDLDTVAVSLGPTLPGEALWPGPGPWRDAVAASALAEHGVLRLDAGLVYLDRFHALETQVLDDLRSRALAASAPDEALLRASLDRVFPGARFAEQRAAGERAARQATTVLTGGPGTGKTTAVAGLLVALLDQAEQAGTTLRIALAAPTGKAAARLSEAIEESAAGFAPVDRSRLAGLSAATLHRLLGPHPATPTRFRHHRANKLPHDVVVVDETSMVSLSMMARLLEAVRPEARLVLVGDPDQLASVEAGAVLGDLVRGYADHPDSPVTALATSHRFGPEIGRLAAAVRDGDADAALEVLAAGHPSVVWVRDDDPTTALRATAGEAALRVRDRAEAGDAAGALEALGRHRLMCAHRDGPYGVRVWNRRVEGWLTAETGDPLLESAYVGRPLLVTANDHALGVYNGDAGVVVREAGGRRVALRIGGETVLLAPSRLGDVETMHAMTIHKSQGSQAAEVSVLLPREDSRLLTRELLYTALTRAQEVVRVVGPEPAVRAAIGQRAQRASGLARRLAALAE